MKRQSHPHYRDVATLAQSRMERRGKRRIARDVVERGERQRRGLMRVVLSGGAVAALATAATLFEAALW